MDRNPILIFSSGQGGISLRISLLQLKYPGYNTIIRSLTQTLDWNKHRMILKDEKKKVNCLETLGLEEQHSSEFLIASHLAWKGAPETSNLELPIGKDKSFKESLNTWAKVWEKGGRAVLHFSQVSVGTLHTTLHHTHDFNGQGAGKTHLPSPF